MDYGFEDEKPSHYTYFVAVPTTIPEPKQMEHLWLESYLPYGEPFHWFYRFDRGPYYGQS